MRPSDPSRDLRAAARPGRPRRLHRCRVARLGAAPIAPGRVVSSLWGVLKHGEDAATSHDTLILLDIRAPRTGLGLLVGAALAVSGALLQGLFRNPLADPGLVGVSAGAALAAATVIVLGNCFALTGFDTLRNLLLPVAAFGGGLLATVILYAVATRAGRTSIPVMLLAGVALGALSNAITGLLVYLSDDRQLRDLTFWSLGSLSRRAARRQSAHLGRLALEPAHAC